MEDLKQNISRRKRWDAVFALLGVVLITGSLAILGELVADLVHDGAARLIARTYVREDGKVPSKLDILGVLTQEPAPDGKTAWFVNRDPIDADLTDAKGLSDALDGQRVVVSGGPPEPGEVMEVDKVAPFPETGDRPRVARRDMIGVLTRKPGGRGWVFTPQKVWLDTSEASAVDLDRLKGHRVAVAGAFKPAEGRVVVSNAQRLDSKSFFTTMPSRRADQAGIHSAWVGTVLVMLVTICTAVPLGVGAGVYLEEYARKNWFTALIEINIANLAGVPSIIWGLMALGLFVYKFHFGHSILTAGLTLGLLVLPIVIIATRESIRAIPAGIRDASYALGATKWETVRHHVLPYSMGGILTGMIVSLSRAIGETAPLITIGALTYVAFLPPPPVRGDFPFVSFAWLRESFTVMPIQMFNWISRPTRDFHANAAAAGVVLLAMTLGMNAFAIVLRYRLRRRITW
jgi:phosphate transport system permease protein